MQIGKTKLPFFQPLCKFINALITHQLKHVTIKNTALLQKNIFAIRLSTKIAHFWHVILMQSYLYLYVHMNA